jgi:hypothetical protein
MSIKLDFEPILIASGGAPVVQQLGATGRQLHEDTESKAGVGG